MKRIDLMIIGAGPVGLCFVRAMAHLPLKILVVDRQSSSALAQPADDGRFIAISHPSRQLLARYGIWDRLASTEIAPLQQAQIDNGHSSSPLVLGHHTSVSPPLGWLVANQRIRQAAWDCVQNQGGVEWATNTQVQQLQTVSTGLCVTLANGEQVLTRCLVAADGRFSQTRQQLGIGACVRQFGQAMLLCQMRIASSHQQTALQWFGYGKTVALLPLNGHQASAVITLAPTEIAQLMQLDACTFGKAVTSYYEGRYGAMTLIGKRHVMPLAAVYADQFMAPRAALIGDAAVGMHPMTAHGFNFGLQSQARLAMVMQTAWRHGQDIADPDGLRRYANWHRCVTQPLFTITNHLARLYTQDYGAVRWLRTGALSFARHLPPFQWAVEGYLTRQPLVWMG